jgi:hypothetical protein
MPVSTPSLPKAQFESENHLLHRSKGSHRACPQTKGMPQHLQMMGFKIGTKTVEILYTRDNHYQIIAPKTQQANMLNGKIEA